MSSWIEWRNQVWFLAISKQRQEGMAGEREFGKLQGSEFLPSMRSILCGQGCILPNTKLAEKRSYNASKFDTNRIGLFEKTLSHIRNIAVIVIALYIGEQGLAFGLVVSVSCLAYAVYCVRRLGLLRRELHVTKASDTKSKPNVPRVLSLLILAELIMPKRHAESAIDYLQERERERLESVPDSLHWVLLIAKYGCLLRMTIDLWLNLITDVVRKMWRAS